MLSTLLKVAMDVLSKTPSNHSPLSGIISDGPQKKTGGHDHRYNTGDDRTPAQKAGDAARSSSKS